MNEDFEKIYESYFAKYKQESKKCSRQYLGIPNKTRMGVYGSCRKYPLGVALIVFDMLVYSKVLKSFLIGGAEDQRNTY